MKRRLWVALNAGVSMRGLALGELQAKADAENRAAAEAKAKARNARSD
jgi:hypothetical protein